LPSSEDSLLLKLLTFDQTHFSFHTKDTVNLTVRLYSTSLLLGMEGCVQADNGEGTPSKFSALNAITLKLDTHENILPHIELFGSMCTTAVPSYEWSMFSASFNLVRGVGLDLAVRWCFLPIVTPRLAASYHLLHIPTSVALVLALNSSIENTAKGAYAEKVVHMYDSLGQSLAMVRELIHHHVQTVDTYTVLFRSEHFLVKVVLVCLQRYAADYLDSVLDALSQVVLADPHADSTAVSRRALDVITRKAVPHRISSLLNYAYNVTERRFGGHGRVSVATLFFLRLLCPRIMSAGCGKDWSPEAQALMQTFAKTLQQCINLDEAGDRVPSMRCLPRDLALKFHSQLQQFQRRVLGVTLWEKETQPTPDPLFPESYSCPQLAPPSRSPLSSRINSGSEDDSLEEVVLESNTIEMPRISSGSVAVAANRRRPLSSMMENPPFPQLSSALEDYSMDEHDGFESDPVHLSSLRAISLNSGRYNRFPYFHYAASFGCPFENSGLDEPSGVMHLDNGLPADLLVFLLQNWDSFEAAMGDLVGPQFSRPFFDRSHLQDHMDTLKRLLILHAK